MWQVFKAQSTRERERVGKDTKKTTSAGKSLRQKYWIPPKERFQQSQGSFILIKTGVGEQGRITLYTTVEERAPWASFFLTPASGFQLLLLYHFFPEMWWLVKNKYTYDGHCDQDKGDENHEEDTSGVGERSGQWLLSWDQVSHVQHVA